VFSKFVDFCPYCFTTNCADNFRNSDIKHVGYKSITFEVACTCSNYVQMYRKTGHCSDPDTLKLCQDNEDAYQLAILLLRAVIVRSSQRKEFKEF